MIWNFSDGASYQSLFMITAFSAHDVDFLANKICESFPISVTLSLEPFNELLHQYHNSVFVSELSREVILNSVNRRSLQVGPGLLLQYDHEDINLRILITCAWISIVRKTSSVETLEMEKIAERIAAVVEGRYARTLG